MDLYFKRHDGQAVTCDDFRAAMADANGRDLAPFAAWCAFVASPVSLLQKMGVICPIHRIYLL